MIKQNKINRSGAVSITYRSTNSIFRHSINNYVSMVWDSTRNITRFDIKEIINRELNNDK